MSFAFNCKVHHYKVEMDLMKEVDLRKSSKEVDFKKSSKKPHPRPGRANCLNGPLRIDPHVGRRCLPYMGSLGWSH